MMGYWLIRTSTCSIQPTRPEQLPFKNLMDNAAQEYADEQTEEILALQHQVRNKKIRQYILLFVLFAAIGAVILFRQEMTTQVLALKEQYLPGQTNALSTKDKASNKTQKAVDASKHRQDELEKVYGATN